MAGFEEASQPGKWLVDVFPICKLHRAVASPCIPLTINSVKYIPSWFPFAEFKRNAKKWRSSLLLSVSRTFDFVKAEMVRVTVDSIVRLLIYTCTEKAAGTATPSFTSRALEDPPAGATEDMIKWAAGSLCKLGCFWTVRQFTYARETDVASVDTITSTMTNFVLSMVSQSRGPGEGPSRDRPSCWKG